MADSSNPQDKKPTSSENWFLRQWKENEEEGLINLILITANKLQMSKTSCGMRICEVVERDLHGREWPIENLGFETSWYIRRKHEVAEWTPLVLDEPNRAAGNRQWFSEENIDFAEDLQTTAYQHRHGIFPLPHQHLADNALVGICTAQIVVVRKGVGEVFAYDRDQLNRAYKTRTYRVGTLYFKKPSPKLWHEYMQKRSEYTGEREKLILARSDKRKTEINAQASEQSPSSILEEITRNPQPYIGITGKISYHKILAIHTGLPQNRAQVLATQANTTLAEDLAERKKRKNMISLHVS